MKFKKPITRNPVEYARATKHDVHKRIRSYDPVDHPLKELRQRQAAITAAKMHRMMAKPFVCSHELGFGGCEVIVNCPHSLSTSMIGTTDGYIVDWNPTLNKERGRARSHETEVTGIAFAGNDTVYSCDNSRLKCWRIDSTGSSSVSHFELLHSFPLTFGGTFLSHSCQDDQFLMGEIQGLSLYSSRIPHKPSSSSLIRHWDCDKLSLVAGHFHPTIQHMALCSSKGTNKLLLFDVREKHRARELLLVARANALSWNPQQPYQFITASEDYCIGRYDLRKWDRSMKVLLGHTNAVMDVDFNRTGTELVSGSFDGSIKFWMVEGECRDTYHNARMNRVTQVRYSLDQRFVFSGSDDRNLRVWKANASERLGLISTRERLAIEANTKLIEVYGAIPEVHQVLRSHRLPRRLHNERRLYYSSLNKTRRKAINEYAPKAPPLLREDRAGVDIP